MKQKYKRWFSGLIMVLVLTWIVSPLHAEGESGSENHVAVVNGSPITEQEFEREMTRVEQMLQSRGKHLSAPETERVRKQVLEDLINRELLYQESRKKGIKVDEVAIDERLGKLKEQFPSETAYKTALEQASLSEPSLKDQIRQEMAIQHLIDEQFGDKLTVSDGESESYYQDHPDFFKRPEQVRASHILIKVDPQANESEKAEARQRIEKIQEKIRQGEDFEALARQYSECPSAAKGGDLQYFRRGQMVKPFETAAFSLKPGEVSEIVETRFGYHLIKLTDKPDQTVPYEDVKGKIKEFLRQEKARGETIPYVETLKKGAEVERLMKTEP